MNNVIEITPTYTYSEGLLFDSEKITKTGSIYFAA